MVQCEHLKEDKKSCEAVSSGEGQEARERGCVDESNTLCCYLCEKQSSCETSCTFLGKTPGQEKAETMRLIPADIADYVIMEDKEEMVLAGSGWVETFGTVLVVKGQRRTPTLTEAKRKQNGTLVLTNRRLLWMAKRGYGDTHHISVEIPLEQIRGVSFGGSYLSIDDAYREYRFHLKSTVAEDFDCRARPLILARRKEAALERRKERVRVLLGFSEIKDLMAKGGLNLQAVKCPVCGASLKLPEKGNLTNCKNCGNEIYAQDILEKIRDLIT